MLLNQLREVSVNLIFEKVHGHLQEDARVVLRMLSKMARLCKKGEAEIREFRRKIFVDENV